MMECWIHLWHGEILWKFSQDSHVNQTMLWRKTHEGKSENEFKWNSYSTLVSSLETRIPIGEFKWNMSTIGLFYLMTQSWIGSFNLMAQLNWLIQFDCTIELSENTLKSMNWVKTPHKLHKEHKKKSIKIDDYTI